MQAEEDEKVRINITVTRKFHKKVKQMALDKDTSIKDLVLAALNEYMVK